MDLDRLVDDLASSFRDHRFDHVHPDPGLAVAQDIHGLGGLQDHEAHGLDLDAGARDQFEVLAKLDERLAECFAGHAASHHQVQRPFRLADRAHAVMDPARPQAALGDFEAAAFAEQHVLLRNAAVVEPQMHMAVRRVVVTEHGHRLDDVDARRVLRYEDLRLLAVRRRVGVGLHHSDHDLAAAVASTGDVELLAVQDPLVAVEARLGRDLLGVGRGEVGFGHGVGRPDLAREERLQPFLLLLGRAVAFEHLHVARVGGAAVQALRRDRVLAQFSRDVGVVEVLEALAGVGVGKEEVPQAVGLRLVLEPAEDVFLPRGKAPAVTVFERGFEIGRGLRFDLFVDEFLDRGIERLDLLAHDEIVQVGLQIGLHGFRHGRFPLCVDG